MELEQIIKQLDWLDAERRKDKVVLASLQDRLSSLEANSPDILQQINDLGGELTRLSALSRFEKLESSIGKINIDITRKVDEIEKKRSEHEREAEKVRMGDLELINKSLGDLRKRVEVLKDIKNNLKIREEEEFRLSRLIEELENKFEEYLRTNEDTKRIQKIMEEGRRQDTKRLMDMQNEVTSLRKRSDENRGRLDLISDDLRKSEMPIKELLASEQERRQEQNVFMEKQNLLQVERNRNWKDWQTRFEDFSNRTTTLDTHLQSLEALNRDVKRAQEGYEEMRNRLERRINEITEMQRLMEERSRNEWSNFKADDQKRWINHSLVLEEQLREVSRQNEKVNERLIKLEDMSQEIQDVLAQFLGDTNNQFGKIINTLKEWFDETEGLRGQII